MEILTRAGSEASGAWRRLLRARGFTGPALFALVLGMGGGAALLSFVDAGLSHPSPVEAFEGITVPGSRGDDLAVTRFGAMDRLLGAGKGLQDAARQPGEIQAAALRELLRTLGAVAVLALLVAGTSLWLLLMMRGSARRRELAIRTAVGATRRDLVRQLSWEGGILSGVGAVGGLIAAGAGVWLLRAGWTPGLSTWLDGAVPARGVLAAIVLLAMVALVGAAAPGTAMARRALQPELAAGDRATSTGDEVRLRRRIAAAAVAGSVVLLVGAGVLLRGFSAGQLETERPLHASDTLTLHLAATGAPGPHDSALQLRRLLRAVESIPGVTAASISSPGAWVGLGTGDLAHAMLGPPPSPGAVFPPGILRPSIFHSVAPGYFTAMGIPLLEGRDLTITDGPDAPGALVVNQTFAERMLLGLDPIGKKVQLGSLSVSGEFYTVVGVVPDLRVRGLGVSPVPQPAVYLSALQVPPSELALAVRFRGDPGHGTDDLKDALGRFEGYRMLDDPVTLEERFEVFAAPMVWLGRLFAVAALLAGLLAVRGLHGVIAYSVRQRRREIGVRMALGASPRAILRLVLRDSVRLTAGGAIVGLAGALCLARLLEYLFDGVDALDPLVYGGVAVLVLSVALGSAIGPARAAARLQPVRALGEE